VKLISVELGNKTNTITPYTAPKTLLFAPRSGATVPFFPSVRDGFAAVARQTQAREACCSLEYKGCWNVLFVCLMTPSVAQIILSFRIDD
jgi:hypothetical protein